MPAILIFMLLFGIILPKRFGNIMTIREIAKKLGLSITTVSRALDGYPDVSQKTRTLVEKTTKEMGYTPNQAARMLRRKRSDTIGYIIPSSRPRFMDPFYSEFVAGLGDASVTHGLDLLVSSVPVDQAVEMQIYGNWVQSRKVDGMVLNRVRIQDKRVQYLYSKHMPFVTLELSKDGIDYPRVEVLCETAYRQLIKHIANLGFRRIAFIGGPEVLVLQFNRFSKYKEALITNGLIYDPNLVILGDLTSSSGFESTKRLLSIPDPPNAIICINDETGFGAMHAISEAGLIVGKDIAVAGFDGVQNAAFSQPPLTTIDQPVYQIAGMLVDMLAKKIKGQPIQQEIITLEPNLIIRESTTGLIGK
jgi:LacI family transcriptional regulator